MAFLAPSPSRQPILNAPASVWCLIVGLALAHGARVLATPAQSAGIIARFAFIPARYGANAAAGWAGSWLDRAVPFVSYMALHNDLTHLGINCVWLLAFGPIVARRFGTFTFLLFFLVCGVAGALAYLACNMGSPEPMIGASGAISGLMAAGLRLLPTLQPGSGRAPLAPVLTRQMLLFTLVWVGMNLLAGLSGIGLAGAGQIAWAAHLGGFFAGLALSGPFDRLALAAAPKQV